MARALTAWDLARAIREYCGLSMLSGLLGEHAWRKSGLGAPFDLDELKQQNADLEQRIADLRLQLDERDQDLAAARSANQRPVSPSEPHCARTKLPPQDQELMAQREDLRVLVPAAHRSSRGSANAFVTPRQASRSSTVHRHATPFPVARASSDRYRVQRRLHTYSGSNEHG
jgi:hypothetical protein